MPHLPCVQLEQLLLGDAKPGDVVAGRLGTAEHGFAELAQPPHPDLPFAATGREPADAMSLELGRQLGEQCLLHAFPDSGVVLRRQNDPEPRAPVVVARDLVVEAEDIGARTDEAARHAVHPLREVSANRRQPDFVEVAATQLKTLHRRSPSGFIRVESTADGLSAKRVVTSHRSAFSGFRDFQMMVAGTMRWRLGE